MKTKESLESMEVDNYNTYLYAHGGHIGHVTLIIYKHCSTSLILNLASIGQGVSEREIFENVGLRADNGCPPSTQVRFKD